jgi:cell division protein FtsW
MSTAPVKKSDITFFIYFACVLIFGLIFLTSASSVVGYDKFGDAYYFIKHQLLLGFLPGILGLLFFAKFDYKLLKQWSPLFFVGSLILLFLVFIPGIGSALNTGNRSWIVIGGFSFQPAEIAKFCTILYFSAFLSKMGDRLQNFKQGFLVALGIGAIPLLFIMFQPDIGTMAILFSIIFGLLFVANVKWSHMSLLGLVSLCGFLVLILIAPYRLARLTTFLHPEKDPQGIGYHINQSFIAIGSGEFFGEGLGQSKQKYQYLPEVHADSIFAVIAEEMGFLLTVLFLVLFVLFIHRGLVIARHSGDMFARFTITGVMIWFVAQAFLNIGAMVGLMPLTGVPLPFVSHGGTALAIAMCAVGVVINMSKDSELRVKN